ncbi:MAG: hypothetical protein HXX17_00775 [Geobacteraceae bacterium]|nr:hypothetical protein [Geobacteraceae bacterium]
MKKIALIVLLLLPCTVNADICQLVEYPDHYEVECQGNAKPLILPAVAVQPQNADQTPVAESTPDTTAQKDNTAQKEKTAPAADAAKQAAPPVSVPTIHRQGRPPTADRNAAAEARRQLILEQRPAEPTKPTTAQ